MAFAGNIALGVGSTTKRAAANLRERLALGGFTVEEFASGESMEAAIRARRFDAVVDLALADLAEEVVGSERLTVAGLLGVPQLLVPGGLDPCALRVLDRVSKEVALKASAARGPTAIVVPERGWSDHLQLDAEKLRVLVAGLRLWLAPQVELRIVPDAVSGSAFAQSAIEALNQLISSRAPNSTAANSRAEPDSGPYPTSPA